MQVTTPPNNENIKPEQTSIDLDYILKSNCEEYSKNTQFETSKLKRPLSLKFGADSFQTPIIGQKHCGVKLKQTETKSLFPETMLIQIKGFYFKKFINGNDQYLLLRT